MIAIRFILFFFFKQKTAYEMRISDWSSDVCSSDLHVRGFEQALARLAAEIALEIEREAALVAVELHEGVAHARRALRHDVTESIPRRHFDLDHVGTEIAEDLGGERPHSQR